LSAHIIHLETSETQLPAGTTDNQMYVYCTKSASFQAREPNALINPEVLPWYEKNLWKHTGKWLVKQERTEK
jgi:hypothetical protein